MGLDYSRENWTIEAHGSGQVVVEIVLKATVGEGWAPDFVFAEEEEEEGCGDAHGGNGFRLR